MFKRLWVMCFFFMIMQVNAQEPSLSICTDDVINTALSLTGTYTPSNMEGFITLENNRLIENGNGYAVRGINYYPSQYPWRRFLVESDMNIVQHELTLLRTTNLNTLRIFLWNEALFQCFGS
ncbi:MAG: hypothetical protein WBC91_18390, partial [Phototrophicaceae bacterium]